MPRQAASDAPVKIAIRIHDPIVHERIDSLQASSILSRWRARRHVERDRLVAHMVGEDGHALLDWKMVILLANKCAVAGA